MSRRQIHENQGRRERIFENKEKRLPRHDDNTGNKASPPQSNLPPPTTPTSQLSSTFGLFFLIAFYEKAWSLLRKIRPHLHKQSFNVDYSKAMLCSSVAFERCFFSLFLLNVLSIFFLANSNHRYSKSIYLSSGGEHSQRNSRRTNKPKNEVKW